MAALIGGTTVHGGGQMPVKMNLAYEATGRTKSGGNVDELFLRAQSIRWLISNSTEHLPEGISKAFLQLLRASA